MAVNYVPMTPLTLLRRSARVFPDRIATVYEGRRVPYVEFFQRVCRLANGLGGLGLAPQGRVAVLAPNVPMMLEAHFGVPLAGGVIVAINTRLSPREVAYILKHSGSEILLVDRGMLGTLREILGESEGESKGDIAALRKIIVVEDPLAGEDDGWRPEEGLEYEAFLAEASAEEPDNPVSDEEQLISLNYTSGTTGQPKGVMFTHRGAYLNSLSDCLQNGLTRHSVYLWTLPMFHCNGWCFTWAVHAAGATSVCMRAVKPVSMRELIESEGGPFFVGLPSCSICWPPSPTRKGSSSSNACGPPPAGRRPPPPCWPPWTA